MNINDVAKELLLKFKEIKNKGWIKSSRKHNTGIGKTFEDKIDKLEDNLSNPDYNGIEIKTHRSSSDSYTTLFTSCPNGPVKGENTRLRKTYGHIDNNSNLKTLHSSIYANRKTTFFNMFKFQLEINRKEKKIYFIVFDMNDNLLEKTTYWTFEKLKKKLTKKLKFLAYIKSKNKIENNQEFFLYEKITFYKFKNFDKFLDLLENGDIMVDFRIGVYCSGKNIGKTHDHGTGFRIKEENLLKLYDEYIIDTKKED